MFGINQNAKKNANVVSNGPKISIENSSFENSRRNTARQNVVSNDPPKFSMENNPFANSRWNTARQNMVSASSVNTNNVQPVQNTLGSNSVNAEKTLQPKSNSPKANANASIAEEEEINALYDMVELLQQDKTMYHINKVVKNINVLHNPKLMSLRRDFGAFIKNTDYTGLKKQAYKLALMYARTQKSEYKVSFQETLKKLEEDHFLIPYANLLCLIIDEGNGKSSFNVASNGNASLYTTINTNGNTGEKDLRWVGSKKLTINKFIKFIVNRLEDIILMMPINIADKRKVKSLIVKFQKAIVNDAQYVNIPYIVTWLCSLPFSCAVLIDN